MQYQIDNNNNNITTTTKTNLNTTTTTTTTTTTMQFNYNPWLEDIFVLKGGHIHIKTLCLASKFLYFTIYPVRGSRNFHCYDSQSLEGRKTGISNYICEPIKMPVTWESVTSHNEPNQKLPASHSSFTVFTRIPYILLRLNILKNSILILRLFINCS